MVKPQHLDIWIPAINVAVEYHGIQHFTPFERFGGVDSHQKSEEKDDRKRLLCAKNNVRLLEVAYDMDIPDSDILEFIHNAQKRR